MKRLLLFILFLAGLAIASWAWLRYDDSKRPQQIVLTPNERNLLGVDETDANKVITFVVAGRDRKYLRSAGNVIYDSNGNPIGRSREAESNAYGTNTDTILYGVLKGNELKLIAIPRDTWLPNYVTKVNAMYNYQGGEGLARAVEDLVGLPAEYYVVINIDIFQRVVDALGGIEVDVPYRMCYNDYAAQLHVDLSTGPQSLDGTQAASFVRYRQGNCRGASTINDTQRLDNLQLVANAILAQARRLSSVGAIPELIRSYSDEIETNADINLMLSLVPRLNSLALSTFTLPTHSDTARSQIDNESVTVSVEVVDRERADAAIANFFGGTTTPTTDSETIEIADVAVVLRDQSGVNHLGDYVKKQLIAQGLPAHRITVLEEIRNGSSSQVRAESEWADTAQHYAQLLHTGYSQVTQFSAPNNIKASIEIILGEDMQERYISQYLTDIATASADFNISSTNIFPSDPSSSTPSANTIVVPYPDTENIPTNTQNNSNPTPDNSNNDIIITLP